MFLATMKPKVLAKCQQHPGLFDRERLAAARIRIPAQVGRFVTLWRPAQGGHAGFPRGAFPADVLAMPQAVADWLAAHG